MNEAIRTMLERRSVRHFTEQAVEQEKLEMLLSCALYAPTSANCQTSRFLVIRDPDRLRRLNRAYCEDLAARELREGQGMNVGIRAARQEGFSFFYGAGVLITAVAPRNNENSMANCAIGLEHIQLAAWSLGLGSCWSNQGKWLTDVDSVRSIFREVGLREDEDIFGSVVIGYPSHLSNRERPRTPGRIEYDMRAE